MERVEAEDQEGHLMSPGIIEQYWSLVEANVRKATPHINDKTLQVLKYSFYEGFASGCKVSGDLFREGQSQVFKEYHVVTAQISNAIKQN